MSENTLMVALALTGLAAALFIFLYRKCLQQQLSLESYVIYLLLDDEIRQNHKSKLQEWIRNTAAKDAAALGFSARSEMLGMAERLAPNSLLAANAMIWKQKKCHDG